MSGAGAWRSLKENACARELGQRRALQHLQAGALASGVKHESDDSQRRCMEHMSTSVYLITAQTVYIKIFARGLGLELLRLGTRNGRVVPSTLAFYDSFGSWPVPTLAFCDSFCSWIVPTLANYDSFHFSIVSTLAYYDSFHSSIALTLAFYDSSHSSIAPTLDTRIATSA